MSSFQVSGPSTSIAGVSADDCSQDYVLIQSAASALSSPAANTHDRSKDHNLRLKVIIPCDVDGVEGSLALPLPLSQSTLRSFPSS